MITFKRIRFKNFMSFKDETLELDNRGMLLILGQNNTDAEHFRSNASGKSAMFDAIYYALYGVSLRRLPLSEDIIRWGEDTAEVEMEMTVNDEKYIITRTKKKTGGTLKVVVDGKDVSMNDMRETQKQVINQMINPDIARNAIFFLASEFQSFIMLGDADKKNIITKIFNLDKIEGYRDIAKQKYDEYETLNDNANTEMQVIISNIEETSTDISRLDDLNMDDVDKEIESTKEFIAKDEEQEKKIKKVIAQNKEVVKELREGYETENAKKLKLEIERSKEEEHLSNLKKELSKVEKLVELGKCPTCKSKIQKLNFKSEIDSLRGSIVDINIIGIQKKIDVIDKEMNEARDYIDGYDEKVMDDEGKLNKIRKSLDSYTKNMYDLETKKKVHLTKLDELKKRLLSSKKRLEEVKVKIKEYEEQMATYDFWITGFGPQGIVSYILDSYFPKFNTLLNEYLQVLFGSGVYAKFSPFTRLKSGEFREKWSFDIEGLGSYGSCSAGEKRRIDVAVLFALNTMVRDMLGGTNILVIDEVFDPLDDIGAERVIDLLKKLQLSSVFVVTHNEALQEQFENQMMVVKSHKISKIVS